MKASRFLAALAESLPPERLQHDRVTRSEQQIADSQGGIGRPYVVETLLARMLRKGEINTAQWFAGNRFAELFRNAGLDPLKAADMGQRLGGSGDLPHGADRARRQLNDCLDALGGLGSPIGSVAWFVLGCEISLQQWGVREGWGGKRLSHQTASITLIGALGVLARHFGLSRDESA